MPIKPDFVVFKEFYNVSPFSLSSNKLSAFYSFNTQASFYAGSGGGSVNATVGVQVYSPDGGTFIEEYTRVKDIGTSANTFGFSTLETEFGLPANWLAHNATPINQLCLRPFLVHPVSGDRVYGVKMSNQYSQRTPTTLTPIDSKLFNASPTVSSVHGSLFKDGYIWGGARTGTNKLVKINKDDYTDVTAYVVTSSTGSTATDLEQIVSVGDYIYSNSFDGELMRFKISAGTYQIYKVTDSASVAPISTDGIHLYIQTKDALGNNRFLRKFNIAQFSDSDPAIGSVPLVPDASYNDASQGGYIDNPATGYTARDKGWIHSIVVDEEYIYAAYTVTTGTTGYNPVTNRNLCEVHKIRKSDMTAAGYTLVVKATDDMCQTDTHIFLGPELVASTPEEQLGIHCGAVNYDKATLTGRFLPYLYKTSTNILSSYGALIFGDYMFELKVDGTLCLMDISHPELWDWDTIVGQFVLGYYKIAIPAISGWPVSAFPANEILWDAATQLFHCFRWNSPNPSGINKIQITDVSFLMPPSLLIVQGDIVGLEARIGVELISDGGLTITSKGLRYGTSPSEISIEIDVDSFIGNTMRGVIPYTDLETDTTYYYTGYATNSKGTGVALYGTFTTPGVFVNPPTLFLSSPTHTGSTINLSATITDDFGAAVSGFGIRYGLTAEAMTIDAGATLEDSTMSANITGLPPSTTYYYYAFATNAGGTGSSSTATFITPAVTYRITGNVLTNDSQEVPGVTMLLYDMVAEDVTQNTVTNDDGVYVFDSLVNGRTYMVTGYKIGSPNLRILPKFLTPTQIII